MVKQIEPAHPYFTAEANAVLHPSHPSRFSSRLATASGLPPCAYPRVAARLQWTPAAPRAPSGGQFFIL